jgi:hypothetical protein
MPLKLNLSDQEAQSEARSFEVLPTGQYLCNIVEIKEETVKPGSTNTGKPYWNVRFVVDEGKYEGRTIYANIMLFEGALYGIKQLVQAVFPDNVAGNELTVPDPLDFEGRQVVVTGQKNLAGSKIKRKGAVIGTRDRDTFEVKGYRAADQTRAKTTSKSDLLP